VHCLPLCAQFARSHYDISARTWCARAHMRTNVYTCITYHLTVEICVGARTGASIHMCMCRLHVCICVDIYMYTHTHTYTRMNIAPHGKRNVGNEWRRAVCARVHARTHTHKHTHTHTHAHIHTHTHTHTQIRMYVCRYTHTHTHTHTHTNKPTTTRGKEVSARELSRALCAAAVPYCVSKCCFRKIVM